MSGRDDLRCAAIWNGCVCDRRPHNGDGHVWRNTLDGDLVDPALYPGAAATPAHPDAVSVQPETRPRAEDLMNAYVAARGADDGMGSTLAFWQSVVDRLPGAAATPAHPDGGIDVEAVARAMIHVRGAHNPTADELEHDEEVRPCAWCRLAAEQAAEAVSLATNANPARNWAALAARLAAAYDQQESGQ